MTRGRLFGALLTAAVVAMMVFIASNTTWEDVPVPTPPKGEAVTNPFYAAQRFAEALGSRARRERTLALPSTDAVMVLSTWHWDLSSERQAAITQWVEAGGRLVVDSTLTGDLETFEAWSGIMQDFNETAWEAHENLDDHEDHDRCTPVQETVPPGGGTFVVCGLDFSFLRTTGVATWALHDDNGDQAIRTTVGRGSVTVINAVPFTWRSLLEGDHGRLFAAATQLRASDEIVFLTEHDHPSLLALLWQYGGPAVALSGLVMVLLLWRGAVRFGPLLAIPEPRRRSMAEQIRGSGRFALDQGDAGALHAASVRALTEAARRKIPAYARLSRPQRATALGKATGLDGEALVAAIDSVSKRRAAELPATLGLLETARRQLLSTRG